MDQRRTNKDFNCSQQSTSQTQNLSKDSNFQRSSSDINKSSIFIDEDINKTFYKIKKVISNIKFHNNQESLNPISLEEFILICNNFLNSSFTNVLDKRVLFASFAMIHQYFLSSNYAPTIEHMLPFTSLWETFQKTFNLLDFDINASKIDETLNKIKLIIESNQPNQNDDIKKIHDYNDITDTFSLLYQCFETLKISTNNIPQLFDKCFLAIENTFNYINEIHSLLPKAILNIKVQLSILQRSLKSQQKTYFLRSYISRINNMMLSIPSTFDKIRFNSNTNFYNDPTFLCKILKSIIDFYSTFLNLMVNITDWKEAQSIFMNFQNIITMIEQPSLTPNNVKLIKKIEEILKSYASDNSFKDNQLLKELSTIIDILPSELYYIRSSFSNFLIKRKEISPEFADSQKIFIVFQAFINFASKLCVSNGPIYDLTYKILQIYSKSLINSIVCEYFDIVTNYMNRINIINMNKNGNSKMIEANIIRMMKLSQDLLQCDIVSTDFKDFLNRFQILLFFLRNILARVAPNAFNKAIPNLLKYFPNFQKFKISTKWLTQDLNTIFQKRSGMIQAYLSQNENNSDFDLESSIDCANSAFGIYGQMINETYVDTLKQYKRFFKFKKCLEDFTAYLTMYENSNIGEELLITPNNFSRLMGKILQNVQSSLSEKYIFDSGIIKFSFNISIFLMYKESATPKQIIDTYEVFLKNFNIPFFKQKIHFSFRYSELFILMKNEGETENDDQNAISIFGESFISYCSFLDDESLQKMLSLYPVMKNLIPMFDFYGFDNMFDTFSKFNSLFKDIYQINTTFFDSLGLQNSANTYDIITFVNLIESFSSIISKLICNKALSDESTEIIHKILELIKEVTPISLYSILLAINHLNLDKGPKSEAEDPQQPEVKKLIDLKEFIKNFSHLLTNLIHSIEFTDFHKIIKTELSVITSMFSYYLNWCPELKFLRKYFNEFIQLSNLINNDITPILFRMLRIINIIFHFLKKHDTHTLEVSSLHQITQKVHSNILIALNMIFLVKDLKIIQNCIHSFSTKYQIVDEKMNSLKYPIDDFFNYQKINSTFLEQLYEDVQNLYFYDSKTSESLDNLAYSEIYEILTPALSIINSLFDESTTHLVSNFFNDGCRQINLLTTRLESNITNIDNKIKEEKLILSPDASGAPNEGKENFEDSRHLELSLYNDNNQSSSRISSSSSFNRILPNQSYEISFSFDSIVNMYKAIIDKKIKQNKVYKKSIDDLKAKLNEHENEISQTNEELINITSYQIPPEFDSYARQILEPLKNIQLQESENSPDKSKDNEPSNDNSSIDIFSGSEFNSNFVNSILMKIEELDQQNGALSRYINVQKFFTIVDEYMKNHQIQTTMFDDDNSIEKVEHVKDKSQSNEEATAKITDNGNDNDNNNKNNANANDNDDDEEYEYEYEYVDDEEKSDEFEQFEQDEIKLIMMINSLRNSGKNKSTLREFDSQNFKESISQVELEFYRLINKACQMFKIVNDSDENDESAFQENEYSDDNSTQSKSSSEKKNLLRLAKSMVQDVSSDDDN